MKISDFNPISGSGGVKKRSGVSGGGGIFADMLSGADTENAAPAALSDVSAPASLGSLLALQEIPEDDYQRKKLVQKGKNLLDKLDELRARLLAGTISPHLLVDIGRQIEAEQGMTADPALRDIIDDIELRAAVELAKLEMALAEKNGK